MLYREMDITKIETEKVLCNQCKKVTNHNVAAEYKTSGDAYDGEIQWWTTYQIVRCMGCDDISFRLVSTCTEDYAPQTGKMEESEALFPDRTNGRTPMEDHKRSGVAS